ncbi:MAG: hypothetical protein JWO63_3424, partial [Frankiales bacterium]|nr:hypothetical protein [Frankiales bacterium]
MTSSSTRLSSVDRRGRASRVASILVVVLIMALLLVFFVLPVLWLLLAPTKTAGE